MEFHKALELSSFFLIFYLVFEHFPEVLKVVHCGSIPTAINGRVVPLLLPRKFAFTSAHLLPKSCC